METGVRSLEFYEDYFNIKYPLPKCDMIAIPDFQAGAMENWGLVTYRSTCILFDADKVQYELKLALFRDQQALSYLSFFLKSFGRCYLE